MDRKRFRVLLPDDVTRVGERYVAQPGQITEEWALSGRVKPVRVHADRPRVGLVMAIRPPDDPNLGTRGWEAICEDIPAFPATTGAVLSVIGTRQFGPHEDVAALLNHLSHGQTGSDVAVQAAFARAILPWLRRERPDLGYAADRYEANPPTDPDSWLAGVEAVMGSHIYIDAPPLTFTYTPPRPTPNLSAPLRLREDVIDRLTRRHREN